LYNSLFSNVSEFMFSVPRVHGHKRLDDDAMHWLIAASTIDWSNCAHSSIRHVLSSSASAILLSAIFSVKYLLLRNYYITWRPLSNPWRKC